MRRKSIAAMTEEDENRLVEDLLDVLDRVVDSSGCRDMAPLWLVATQKVRADRLRQSAGKVGSVPDKFMMWKKDIRSKWAALAAWRHAVLQSGILSALGSREQRAVEAIYFTPFERNDTPYSWSRASSRAPAAHDWSSATALDARAKAGCADSVKLLKDHALQLTRGANAATEARAAFIEVGARDGTLKDILRYESVRARESKESS